MPAGPEFLVDTYGVGIYSRAASDASGNFIVVWMNPATAAPNAWGIKGRRFDSSGAALGEEFQINAYTGSSAVLPSVAISDNGTFVVVWTSYYGRGSRILGRLFDSTGTPVTGEFVVDQHGFLRPRMPDVSMDAAGRFVVVWQGPHYYFDGITDGVYGRRFDSAGAPDGGKFRVDFYLGSEEYRAEDPRIASSPSGAFVVVWRDYQDSGAGVLARRFDSSGATLGFIGVSTTEPSYQDPPDIAMNDSGDFVVVWTAFPSSGGRSIKGRLFDSAGSPKGGDFVASSSTTSGDERPAVSMDEAGGFVVVWGNQRGDDYGRGVSGRAFDGSGAAQGLEFQVATRQQAQQSGPDVTVDPAGNAVAVWHERFAGSGVWARRFLPAASCVAGDADADGVCESADVCPGTPDPAQLDRDADARGDACDNCASDYNPGQEDADSDGIGDACDPCVPGDADADDVCDDVDNCLAVYNSDQTDTDADAVGDACDNCPAASNPAQTNSDGVGEGDACDLTITFPLDGSQVDCAGAPPVITWTPESYTKFKVFLGADPEFRVKETSGTLQNVSAYAVPESKWASICRHLSGTLYLQVDGTAKGTSASESSSIVVLTLP